MLTLVFDTIRGNRSIRDLPAAQRFAGVERIILPTTPIEALQACTMLPEVAGFVAGRLQLLFETYADTAEYYEQKLQNTAFCRSSGGGKVHVTNLEDCKTDPPGTVQFHECFASSVQNEVKHSEVKNFIENACNELLNDGRYDFWHETTLFPPIMRIRFDPHIVKQQHDFLSYAFFEMLFDDLLKKQRETNIFRQIALEFWWHQRMPADMSRIFTTFVRLFQQQRFANLVHHILIQVSVETDPISSPFFEAQTFELGSIFEAPVFIKLDRSLSDLASDSFPPIELVCRVDVRGSKYRAHTLNEFKRGVEQAIWSTFAHLSDDAQRIKTFKKPMYNSVQLRSIFYEHMSSVKFNIHVDAAARVTYGDDQRWLRSSEQQLMRKAVGEAATKSMDDAEAAEMFLLSSECGGCGGGGGDAVYKTGRSFPNLKTLKVRLKQMYC